MRWPCLGRLPLISAEGAEVATMINTTVRTMRSATVSVPSSLIAMMPATAAGTVRDRDETRIIDLACTIVYTIDWIEDMIDFTNV